MPDEPALLDTNIFVYSVFQDAPQHLASRKLLERALKEDAALCVAAQSMAEFYSVITNPRRVTNARSPAEAIGAIQNFLAMPGLALIAQPIDLVGRWCDLLHQHPVSGSDIFDIQLIATMLANGVHQIYTFNTEDFKPFSQIRVLTA